MLVANKAYRTLMARLLDRLDKCVDKSGNCTACTFFASITESR